VSSDNFEGFKQFGPGFHGILPIMILKIMLCLLSPKRKNVTHLVNVQFNLLNKSLCKTDRVKLLEVKLSTKSSQMYALYMYLTLMHVDRHLTAFRQYVTCAVISIGMLKSIFLNSQVISNSW